MNKHLRYFRHRNLVVFCLFTFVAALFWTFEARVESRETKTAVDGFWRQIAYGRILEIKQNKVTIYDVSSVSCFVSFEEELNEIGRVTKVNKKSLTIVDGINILNFQRLEKLPALCTSNEAKRTDALYNFDALWHSFDENYAFFKVRGVDWDEYFESYRSRLSSNSTELELYEVLSEMLDSIGDGHVKLEVPDSVKAIDSKKPPENKIEESKPKLNNYQLRQRIRKSITDRYLEEVKSYNAGVVRWGMMNDEVAYLQINWMIFLANYNIPDGLDFQEFLGNYAAIAENRSNQNQDEYYGARFVMNRALKDLKNAKSMIVDIRFNGGGKDESALEFLSHFNSKKRTAFTKKARLGNKFTSKNRVNVKPSDEPFNGDVYLLTSPQTASAAEIMTLGSMVFPKIQRIGSETEGIFSDVLEKKLPIGWEYSLSNEVYQDLNGVNYEGTGIPPQYRLEYSRETREFYEQIFEQMDNGDDAIELALKLIRSGK